MDIDSIARTVLSAYDDAAAVAGPRPVTTAPVDMPDELLRLEPAEAYDLQARCVSELCKRWGVEQVGFKVSVTNEKDQARIDATEPTYGRLTSRHLLPDGAEIDLDAENAPLLEPELAMRTLVEFDADATEADVADNVEVAAALEIPVCRFRDWFPEGQEPALNVSALIGDNSVAGYVATGEWHRPDGLSFDDIGVRVTRDGETVVEGNSSAVLGNPLRSVVWLAGKLAERDESLPAGAVISSGTFTAPLRPARGLYRAEYDSGVGTVTVHFT